MYRCPHCGQAHVAVAEWDNGKVIEKHPIVIDIVGDSNADVHIQFFSQKRGGEWIALGTAMESEGFEMPETLYCPFCQNNASTDDWRKCFDDPTSFDELSGSENLCWCGGELYMERLSNRSMAWVCDECGWIKPGVVKVDG